MQGRVSTIAVVLLCAACDAPPPKPARDEARVDPVEKPAASKHRLEGDGESVPIDLDAAKSIPAPERDWSVVEVGERDITVPAHDAPLRVLSVSSDGSWALTLDEAGVVCSWSVANPKLGLERCFETEVGSAARLLAPLSSTRRFVIAGGRDVQLLGRAGVVVTRWVERSAHVQTLCAAADSNMFWFAAGREFELSKDDFLPRTVATWTTSTPPILGALDEAGAVTWLDDSGTLYARAAGRTATTRPIPIERTEARVRSLSRRGRRLASATETHVVVHAVGDEGASVEHRLSHDVSPPAALHWAPDGDALAVVGRDRATVWTDLDAATPNVRVLRSEREVRMSALSTNARLLISDDDRTIRDWPER